jgi:rhodanese-related sulfurtransferase
MAGGRALSLHSAGSRLLVHENAGAAWLGRSMMHDQLQPIRQMTPTELHAWLADSARTQPVLVDVREPWEFAICHLPGALLLPMAELLNRYETLDREAEIVVICHHGLRSLQAGRFLSQTGFRKIFNLQGGLAAWSQTVDASLPA